MNRAGSIAKNRHPKVSSGELLQGYGERGSDFGHDHQVFLTHTDTGAVVLQTSRLNLERKFGHVASINVGSIDWTGRSNELDVGDASADDVVTDIWARAGSYHNCGLLCFFSAVETTDNRRRRAS